MRDPRRLVNYRIDQLFDGNGDGSNIIYKGVINEPADFPTLTDVKTGDEYSIGYKERIANITNAANVATVTTTSVFYNNFINGNNIIISGYTGAEGAYNGTYVGTKSTPNNITYPIPGAPPSPATGTGIIASPETVIDNDVTKTNTDQTFNNNDEIRWNGNDWSLVGTDRIWVEDGDEIRPLSFTKLLQIGGNAIFQQDLTAWDGIRTGGSEDGNDGSYRALDKNDVQRFRAEADETGLKLFFNALPAITDILQGTAGGALNNALLTSDWLSEHPLFAPTIVNTNDSSSPNYFAGMDIGFDGKTSFTISHTPVTPLTAIFSLNGITATYGVDFTLSGTTLTWLDPTVSTGQPAPHDTRIVKLKTTDKISITFDYSLSAASSPNINQNALVLGGYWNGVDFVSNNPYINGLLEIPDNTIPGAILSWRISTGVAAGTVITDNDLKLIWQFNQNKAATIGYGVAAPMLEFDDPLINNISTDGTIVTVILDRLVDHLKSVGDKIEVVGTISYDGLHVITEIPSIGTQLKFALAGVFPPEGGGGRLIELEYSPQPQHNQHGIWIPSTQNIRIRERTDLADGYYLDVRMDNIAEVIRILPEGSVTLKGQLVNGTAKSWTSGSAQWPILDRHETIRIRKQKTDVWWIEFVRVFEA